MTVLKNTFLVSCLFIAGSLATQQTANITDQRLDFSLPVLNSNPVQMVSLYFLKS